MEKKRESKIENPEKILSLDKLVPNAGGSVFLLARIAMLRSIEIYNGSRPLVDHKLLDKATTIALKEISEGKVTLKNGPLKLELSKKVKAEEASSNLPIKGEN